MSTDERKSAPSPSEIRRRLRAYIRVAQALLDGLEGKRFHWGDTERRVYTEKAAGMGVTLVTKTRLTKMGYRLRRKVQSVGRAYFGAPIKVEAKLYILECQCTRVDSDQERPQEVTDEGR